MFVTQQADGKLVSRPMQLQEIEFDGDIWFLTRTDKYNEIKVNPSVNVAFVGKEGYVEPTKDTNQSFEL